MVFYIKTHKAKGITKPWEEIAEAWLSTGLLGVQDMTWVPPPTDVVWYKYQLYPALILVNAESTRLR